MALRPTTPPLNALRAFEAAARLGSFARAAAELSVTSGAISQQVANLEASLGMSLFERNGPKLTLREAGRAYLPSLRRALTRSRPPPLIWSPMARGSGSWLSARCIPWPAAG